MYYYVALLVKYNNIITSAWTVYDVYAPMQILRYEIGFDIHMGICSTYSVKK